jgi:hypothetical protein
MDGWMEHIEAGGTGIRGKVAGVGWDALDLTLLVHILEEDETLPYLRTLELCGGIALASGFQ